MLGKAAWSPPSLDDVQPNKWESGLFGCFSDPADCCMACFCPPCFYG